MKQEVEAGEKEHTFTLFRYAVDEKSCAELVCAPKCLKSHVRMSHTMRQKIH